MRRYTKIKQFLMLALLLIIYFLFGFGYPGPNIESLQTLRLQYETSLAESLMYDNGTGCPLIHPNPFSEEYFGKPREIKCTNQPAWVKCRFSTCSLQPFVFETVEDVQCFYRDIMYINDNINYVMGHPVILKGNISYNLTNSDHVKIYCFGKQKDISSLVFWHIPSWSGLGAGFRPLPKKNSFPGYENSPNIIIIGFDSISKHTFIRLLPKSYKFIQETLNATVLNKYNIIADGTPEALIPILAGKTTMEIKESRRSQTDDPFDQSSFIFQKLALYGYRTAYFEDSPYTSTFGYRYTGFACQPTDHYMYSFCRRAFKDHYEEFCIGDTPQFKLFLNLTEQFVQIEGKHFILCFIADICHDSYDYVSNADEPLLEFLKGILERGQQENTLIIIMSDHGQRFGKVRSSFHGDKEERLPFMAIRLPDNFKKRSPESQLALESNADVLTTPLDIYPTYLDVIGLPELKVDYKVKGAINNRGLSLIKPIPANRSCSEAGITTVWCTCNTWKLLRKDDPMYERTARAMLDHINKKIISLRSLCAERTLISIESVRKLVIRGKDGEAENGIENKSKGFYAVKIISGPANGAFEGYIKYLPEEDKLQINSNDILRTNAYGREADCLDLKYRLLSGFCYCK